MTVEESQHRTEAIEQIVRFGGKPAALPMHSFLTPSRPVALTEEEIYTRRAFSYLDGRRWGRARAERESLLKISREKNAPATPIYLLETLSDIFEGKPQRAINAYQRAAREENWHNYVLDFYIIRELIVYLEDSASEDLPELINPDNVQDIPLFFSPLASMLYRSKTEPMTFAINELGQMADALINEPGIKRYMAVLLRAIQGNRLLERGEFAWAGRVLDYTSQRSEKIMGFNEPLLIAVQRDFERAQQGINYLSYQ